MKNKRLFRLSCCLAAVCSAFAFSSCAALLQSLLEDSSEKSYAEDEWNPSEDPSTSLPQSSASQGESPEESDESENGNVSLPEADPEKELLRTETDEIGHKIAYYADGTCEDLGRVIPIDFTPVSPTEKEGYQYFASLEKGEGLCAFYNELYSVAYTFHASAKNVTATEEYYEIASMRFSGHGLTSDEAVSVWRTVSLEYPQFFWWANSVLLGRTSLTLLIDPAYAQASDRAAAQTAIEEMAKDCDRYLDGTTSKVERALTIHDFVAECIQYAYESDYVTPEDAIWAHNIVGGALYGKGVCESYAKTYDYLCDLFALPCITATGFAVEDDETYGHAWNAVNIDGGWYNVDITWNDLDSTHLSREWFGTDPDEFSKTHDAFTPDDGWNVNFGFGLPTLDDEGLTPVRAANAEDIHSGKYTADTAPMYPSIEDVCALLDEGITYETYLYPKTAATPTNAEIVLDGATLDRIPHTAGTLVINGEYRPYGAGYYEMAELSSPNAITFYGDVIFRDLSYAAEGLTLHGSTLTTEGTAVEIAANGVITGGNLTDKTTDWTDVTALRLNTVTAQGEELRLLGGGTIERANIHSGVLRLNGGADVSISSLWYATASERLYIDGALNTTKITIGDVTAGSAADEETSTAAVTPETVTIFVVYDGASDYPLISVAKKSTDARLYLLTYSSYSTPQRLGTLINLGESISLSSLRVAYSWNGLTRDISQALLEKTAEGNVRLK